MEAATLDLTQPKQAHADERLRQDLILWLGTTRPDGRPHLVPVWFVWHEGTILVFSKPDYKIRNLQANPQVVMALDDSDGGEDVVLIDGIATLLPAGEVDTTLPVYAEKYAAKLREMRWTPESMAQEYSQAIRIMPTKIRAW